MNRAQFVELFQASLEMLAQSENVTKRELKALSRSLLTALHGIDEPLLYGDIQFINSLLVVLTPVNRKVAVKFFEHFSGFHYSEEQKVFTKKSKKRGVEAQDAAKEFLADPNNNIWSWAERNIEVEVKPFDALKVSKFIESALKKLDGNQSVVIRAILAGGVSVQALMVVLDELAQEAPPAEQQNKEPSRLALVPDAPF